MGIAFMVLTGQKGEKLTGWGRASGISAPMVASFGGFSLARKRGARREGTRIR